MENNGKYKFNQGVYNVDTCPLNTNNCEELYVLYIYLDQMKI